MTDKECAEWLQAIKEKYIHGGDEGFDAKRREAIDHAIELLNNHKTGTWIPIKQPYNRTLYACSCCMKISYAGKPDYCCKCGARLSR
ncbi:MAG: hypothetical protein J5725_12070, partial [Bacteroidales bacterium]|nr:hypothetical protein [Bacteroidales bacterium]